MKGEIIYKILNSLDNKVLDNIEVREKDNMEKYSFRNKENIIQEYNNFENWSKIVIDNLLTKI